MTHDAGPSDWLLALAPALLLLGAYLAGWSRARRRRPWPALHLASWAAGCALLAVALAPPLMQAAHHDPRAHMAVHLLLGMYAPLALVLAAPVTLALTALPAPAARRVTAVLRHPVLHVLSHPVTAGVLVTGGLAALYLTPLYALSLTQPLVHAAVHVHLLASGLLLAWALAGPDPAPRRPGTAVRLTVLLLSAAAHAVLAKTLYARAGELPPGTHQPVTTAEAAAQLMYYGGDVAEVLLAVAVLAQWYRRRARRPALTAAAGRPRR